MQKNKHTQTWSQSFWREKIIRTLLMLALFAVLVFLWNWNGPTQVETTTTNNNATGNVAQTVPDPPDIPENPTPVTQEPPAPVFPFEISLPEGTSDRVSVGTDTQPAYEYTFADGAIMTIYPQGIAPFPTDIEWEYSTDASGNVTVAQRFDELCSAGTTGCSAGNGRIEITAVPEVASDQLVVFIDDDNIDAKTPAQAAVQYEAIVNSIRLVQ